MENFFLADLFNGMNLNMGDIIGFLWLLIIALLSGYGGILIKFRQGKKWHRIGGVIIFIAIVMMLLGLFGWFYYINNYVITSDPLSMDKILNSTRGLQNGK